MLCWTGIRHWFWVGLVLLALMLGWAGVRHWCCVGLVLGTGSGLGWYYWL